MAQAVEQALEEKRHLIVEAGTGTGKTLAAPLGVAVEAVAGDAGLVADNGAAGSDNAVEEGGLADIGASHDGEGGDASGGGG